MNELLMDYDDVVADIAVEPEQRRRFRWPLIVAGVIAIAVLTGGGFLAAPGLPDGRLISGTATANPTAVIEAAADRKAQALADQKARDDALLRTLESQVRSGMQEYFNDPANDMGLPITVIDLSLIKVADNKYEGMATMKAGTHHPRDVLVHVTEDDRNGMWNTDPGALLPLFR